MSDEEDIADWEELFGPDIAVESWPAIPGLTLARQAIPHSKQMRLLEAVTAYLDREKGQNQAMCFGELPCSLQWFESWVRDTCPELFPKAILDRQPLFDQAIINHYAPGQGIVPHVDLARFDDGILIISLLSSCVMEMQPATEDMKQRNHSYHVGNETEQDSKDRIAIILRPGDVLAMAGPARYEWRHGIPERSVDEIGDEVIQRRTRISITLRRMLE